MCQVSSFYTMFHFKRYQIIKLQTFLSYRNYKCALQHYSITALQHYSLYACSHRTMYRTVSCLLDTCCGRLQGSVILQLVGLQLYSVVLLKLGSAEPRRSEKGSQGFRETKMCNGGRVILAALNLYVLITIRVTTFVTNHYVTNSTLKVNRFCSAEASRFCIQFGQQLATGSQWAIRDNGVESNRRFVTCNVHRI